MKPPVDRIRQNFDRAGIALSGLCLVHCVISLGVVWFFGIGGQIVANPLIHEIGLMLAILIGAGAIGWGVWQHRRFTPFAIATIGLCIMGAALTLPHGFGEAVMTVFGLVFVSTGHMLNLRSA